MSVKNWVIGAALMLLCVGIGRADTVGTSAPASKPSVRTLDPKLVPTLLQQGQSALAAGEYPAARDSFSDAASLDPRNTTAWHGKALALMYMGDFRRAVDPMEKAMLTAPPDRALVINAAVMYIGDRLPMRAAKLLREFMTAHQKDVDEPMLNALAVALNDCDAQTKKGNFFHECEQFYLTYNTKLEDHVPGYKRWGITWLPAAEADSRNKDWTRAMKNAELLAHEVEYKETHLADAAKRLDELQKGRANGWQIEDAQRRLEDAQRSRDETANRYQEALDKAHGPEFPRTMAAVAIGDVTVPAAGPTATQVATLTTPPTTPSDDPPVTPPAPHKVVRQPPTDNPPDAPSIPAPAPPVKPVTVKPNAPEKTSGATTPPENAEPAIVLAPKPKQRGSITLYAVAFPVTPDLLITASATVEGTEQISLQGADGNIRKGAVVRSDSSLGVALVRLTEGSKLTPLQLGTTIGAGAVRCASFPTANIFEPVPEVIPGTAVAAGDNWKLNLPRNPRLAGGPVVSGGKVVGVEMATRDAELSQLPCVSIEALLKFLGEDAPKVPGANSDPVSAILQVTATRESK